MATIAAAATGMASAGATWAGGVIPKSGDTINVGDSTHAYVVTWDVHSLGGAESWVNIQGLSKAAACVVTFNGHGLATGDACWLKGITQDAQWSTLNCPANQPNTVQATGAGTVGYPITYIDANTFSIPVNTSAFTNTFTQTTGPGTISLSYAYAAINIGAASGSASRIDFAIDRNTRLVYKDQDLSILATGELRLGTSGAGVVPKTYTAELVPHTTADNSKGINISAGGKLTAYGDPTFYGSKYNYILATQVVIPAATNSVTVTITGNYQGNFAAGQELVIHKGGAYASYINDFARLAVVSAANNGANTDISCTVTERPAALTCLVGADVLNMNRNVMAYKLGYNANLGQYNALRPRITAGATSVVNLNNILFSGWYECFAGTGFIANYFVGRNGQYGGYSSYGSSINYSVLFSLSSSLGSCYAISISNSFLCANIVAISGNTSKSAQVINCYLFGNGSVAAAINGGYLQLINSYVYANNYGIGNNINGDILNGSIGYNKNGIAMANIADLSFQLGNKISLVNVLTLNPPTTFFRNTTIYPFSRMGFENYIQIADAHFLFDSFGDLSKASSGWTGTPPSQTVNCLKVATTQSNLSATAYLDLIVSGKFRVWQEAGTVTYKVFIQSPSTNNHDYGATDLVLYADYLDNNPAGTGHIATVDSTGGSGIARANNWTQSLSVTVTSGADGWVTLYLRLLKYYAATDVFYVDPGLWAGGNLLLGDWSQGELVYPGPSQFGGGGSPSLLPLGVMEVVQ